MPKRFETGTPPFADCAGVTAAVDHLAGLVANSDGSHRERLSVSMAALQSYQRQLLSVLLGGLEEMPHVTLYGDATDRAPLAFFTVQRHTPKEVAISLLASASASGTGTTMSGR